MRKLKLNLERETVKFTVWMLIRYCISFCTKHVTGRFTKGILDSGGNYKETIRVKRFAANYRREFG